MAEISRDNKGRIRSKTIAFRVSPEEFEQIDLMAETSGLSKQDYLIKRCLQKKIEVRPNIRVRHFLCKHLEKLTDELHRQSTIQTDSDVLEKLQYLLILISKLQTNRSQNRSQKKTTSKKALF